MQPHLFFWPVFGMFPLNSPTCIIPSAVINSHTHKDHRLKIRTKLLENVYTQRGWLLLLFGFMLLLRLPCHNVVYSALSLPGLETVRATGSFPPCPIMGKMCCKWNAQGGSLRWDSAVRTQPTQGPDGQADVGTLPWRLLGMKSLKSDINAQGMKEVSTAY